MLSRRVLKYLNLGIAAAVILLLFCTYWFVWRPLPQTEGTVTAPVGARATVTRDSLGVPHIAAASVDDALFLQGYATAQDRLFQMDAMRRLASGELSEVVGAATLESDREARLLRLRRLSEQHREMLSPEDRATMAAYARGVNFFLETHRGRLPLEFTLLRYDPRPWTVADSIAIALQMFYTLTRSWKAEKRKYDMLEGGERAKVDSLFPVDGGGAFVPGSNAWATSGACTATGRPLLASDPHLEYSFPSAWYMVHLTAPGLNVSGVSLPGLPGVLMGHNERIAWGITNLQFDVQDLYFENLDLRTGRYAYRGQEKQARPERESVRVKGSRPVEMLTWVTRHGPVFIQEGGRRLALRWIAAEPGSFQYPFLDIDRATNWPEFRSALSRFAGPGSNFVYADAEGNIGYQAVGKFPIRKKYRGDEPVDGSSGKFEWEGFIPFEELPWVLNPASGIIVSANQNPFPDGYPHPVSAIFAAPYRARQIRARLETRRDWRVGDMLQLQMDVYSPADHFISRQVVEAHERRGMKGGAIAEAVSLLRDWDGQMSTGPAPMIAALVREHLETAVAERASPGKGLAYEHETSPAVLEHLLRERPKEWFGDYGQLLLRSLADAVEEGQRIQGQDLRKWDYGRYNRVFLPNPVAGRLPLVGRYFHIGPAPMSGSPTTVKQITRRHAPSMRMVVDFSDLDRSVHNIAIGQSGQVLSRHYRDQWDAYYRGYSFPMQFRRVEATEILTFLPEAK